MARLNNGTIRLGTNVFIMRDILEISLPNQEHHVIPSNIAINPDSCSHDRCRGDANNRYDGGGNKR